MNDGIYFGKRQRIEKLKNANGSFLFLAMDHQLSIGRVEKLDSYNNWIRFVNENDITGLVLNKGVVRSGQLFNCNKSLILQTVGAPSFNGSIEKIKTASLEDAIRFDATAISIQVNFEEKSYLSQLALCVKLIAKADNYGFPVLCMINILDSKKFKSMQLINYIKFCSEIGCDLIKAPIPIDSDAEAPNLKSFLSTCPPLLLAGGGYNDNFLEDVQKSKALGFSGICIGRNIFNSNNPGHIVSTIKNIFSE